MSTSYQNTWSNLTPDAQKTVSGTKTIDLSLLLLTASIERFLVTVQCNSGARIHHTQASLSGPQVDLPGNSYPYEGDIADNGSIENVPPNPIVATGSVTVAFTMSGFDPGEQVTVIGTLYYTPHSSLFPVFGHAPLENLSFP